jgi:uncharacterized protein (TIGR02246 family)
MNTASKCSLLIVLGLIGLASGWGCLAKDPEPAKANSPAQATTVKKVESTDKADTPVKPADPAEAELRAAAEEFVKAFNAGDAAKLVAHFAEAGEIIDEEGTQYQGTDELKQLFSAFFLKFPGAKLAMDIESVRTVAPNVAIEEGTRVITGKDEKDQAQVRYSSVRTKLNGKWVIASLREFSDDPAPTATNHLAGLEWMIGDWLNEGSDAVVKLKYSWSEDKNFILAELNIQKAGNEALKCSQRIGWDPAQQKIRSWLFDSDGGFSEGVWAPASDKEWIVKSTATLPNGQTGSATVAYTKTDANRFQIKGTQRIVGDAVEPDFEVNVVRKPPVAGKSPTASE